MIVSWTWQRVVRNTDTVSLKSQGTIGFKRRSIYRFTLLLVLLRSSLNLVQPVEPVLGGHGAYMF